MSACSEDDDYEKIEYVNTFDIKDGKLLRAQIDAIYPETNTADITLLDPCSYILSWPTLLGIEFFYHCEDSKGTIEDLMKGWKAFSLEEIVYIIVIPENNYTAERLYIIGHVDIRLTRKCSLRDYLVIYTGSIVDKESATIFDVNNNCTLDLTTFENLDENSPAKPLVFPCLRDNAFKSWFSYNFEQATPGANIQVVVNPVLYSVAGNTNGFLSSTRTIISGEEPGQLPPSAFPMTFIVDYSLWDTRDQDRRWDNRQTIHHTSSYVYDRREILTQYCSSGIITNGWRLRDTTSGEDDFIYLNRKTDSSEIWEGASSHPVSQISSYSVSIKYPYSIKGLDGLERYTTLDSNNLEESGEYLDVTAVRTFNDYGSQISPWIWQTCGIPEPGFYDSSPYSIHVGEDGIYFVERYSPHCYISDPTTGLMTGIRVHNKQMGLIALFKDVPDIDAEHPITTRKCLKVVDIARSTALENTAEALDEFVFEDELHMTVGYRYCAPYVKKQPV